MKTIRKFYKISCEKRQNNYKMREILLTGDAPIVRFEIFVCIWARIAELQRGRNDAAVLLVVAPARGFDSRLTK